MQLRHIRPRTVDWYDALLEDDARGFDRLSPEETLKLRTLIAIEQVAAESGAQGSPRMRPSAP